MADTSAGRVHRWHWLSAAGRAVLLALLAGHLLFRREFAHRNLGEALQLIGFTPPAFLSQAYITEFTLFFFLLPAALWTAWQRKNDPLASRPGDRVLAHGMGPAIYAAGALLIYGGVQALVALLRAEHDTFLVFRQSALAAYALFFACAYVFFGDRAVHVRQGAAVTVGVSLVCASADMMGWLTPMQAHTLYPGEHVFGQQTLPLGVLAAGLLVIYADGSWPWRAAGLCALAMLGWRQSQRVPQSAVVIGMGGSLMLYLVLGATQTIRGNVDTLKRAVLLTAFFGCLFLVYRGVSKMDTKQTTEIRAWSWSTYQDLFGLYERTGMPEKLSESTRAKRQLVSDVEVYKLNAVYMAAGNVSVVNNVWRLLVWQRMFSDFKNGRTWFGAGPGKAWHYPALYHTYFHYGDDREGLDPHNSFLNFLYRYGVVGFALLLAVIGLVLASVWKALSKQPSGGDVLLEGLTLFFFYSAIFAFFTVSLEGPSYAMPFWVSLGLMYAYSRQLLRARKEALL